MTGKPNPKKQLNVQKAVDKLAKAVAFVALFLTSAYGTRMMLANIQENVSFAITALLTLALAYIVFNK